MKIFLLTLLILPTVSMASLKGPVTCAGHAIARVDLNISNDGKLVGTFRTAMGDQGAVLCDPDSIIDIHTGELADSFHCDANSDSDETKHWDIQVKSGRAVLSTLRFSTYPMECFERLKAQNSTFFNHSLAQIR